MMDSLLKVALRSQTIPSGVLFVISLIAWPTVIDLLRDFQGKDRLQFNCVPKLNEVTRQLCYGKYNSAMSPLLTPLDFAGITFGVSEFGWLTVTLMSFWMLRRIDTDETDRTKKDKWYQFYRVFICHICYQLALLIVMMGLFCRYQKLEYPAEYSCFSANTTLTSFNKVAVKITCNDLRYKEKSKVNIAIIVVFSLSIVLCLATIIDLKLAKEKKIERLIGNVDDPSRGKSQEIKKLIGKLLCYHLKFRILQVLCDLHSLNNFLGTGTWQITPLKIFPWIKGFILF